MKPNDPPEAQRLRARLMRHVAARGHYDQRVLDVMAKTPRHWFVEGPLEDAYRDHPRPIGWGQTISQPTIVAIMTDALRLKGNERVLEIGTGSGYQAAVLAQLAREVFTIEIVPELADTARARLGALGLLNVHVRSGDGYLGWPEEAPFDRVILTAAPPEVPQALLDQLREGGALLLPVGAEGDQRLQRWTRTASGYTHENLGAVMFVPMVH